MCATSLEPDISTINVGDPISFMADSQEPGGSGRFPIVHKRPFDRLRQSCASQHLHDWLKGIGFCASVERQNGQTGQVDFRSRHVE